MFGLQLISFLNDRRTATVNNPLARLRRIHRSSSLRFSTLSWDVGCSSERRIGGAGSESGPVRDFDDERVANDTRVNGLLWLD